MGTKYEMHLKFIRFLVGHAIQLYLVLVYHLCSSDFKWIINWVEGPLHTLLKREVISILAIFSGSVGIKLLQKQIKTI